MAPYKTRIVIVRPIDAERFGGTVFLEWLNVSAQFDNPPSWYAGHTEALRRGHAWVFVSAQKAGLEGGDGAVLLLAAKVVNPERYESLTISSDSYSTTSFPRSVAPCVNRQIYNRWMAWSPSGSSLSDSRSRPIGLSFMSTPYTHYMHPTTDT